MPGGVAHKIRGGEAVLSDEQFDELKALLDAQHAALANLLQPVHSLAVKLLAGHEPAPEDSGESTGDQAQR